MANARPPAGPRVENPRHTRQTVWSGHSCPLRACLCVARRQGRQPALPFATARIAPLKLVPFSGVPGIK